MFPKKIITCLKAFLGLNCGNFHPKLALCAKSTRISLSVVYHTSVPAAVITCSVDAHIVLLDEYREFKRILIHWECGEQVAQSVDVVHLLFNGGRHKCGEPPASHLGPKGGVYHVKGFQTLLVFVAQSAINMLDPPVVRDIVASCPGVEIHHCVIAADGFQFANQI